MMPLKIGIGDVLKLKKKHPCGSDLWEVTRTGMDIGMRCLGCNRRVMVPRAKIERRVRQIIPFGEIPPEIRAKMG